jgi:P27 family predicted phage terminase small subunit
MPPQRTPTQQLEGRGSWRAAERKKTEPEVVYAKPDPPSWLRDEALPFFEEAAEELSNLRCVSLSDRTQLALLADAMCDYHHACQQVEIYGATAESKNGGTYLTGAANLKQQCYGRLKDCLDRFGMNPSNRSKVTSLPKKDGQIKEIKPKGTGRYSGGKAKS